MSWTVRVNCVRGWTDYDRRTGSGDVHVRVLRSRVRGRSTPAAAHRVRAAGGRGRRQHVGRASRSTDTAVHRRRTTDNRSRRVEQPAAELEACTAAARQEWSASRRRSPAGWNDRRRGPQHIRLRSRRVQSRDDRQRTWTGSTSVRQPTAAATGSVVSGDGRRLEQCLCGASWQIVDVGKRRAWNSTDTTGVRCATERTRRSRPRHKTVETCRARSWPTVLLLLLRHHHDLPRHHLPSVTSRWCHDDVRYFVFAIKKRQFWADIICWQYPSYRAHLCIIVFCPVKHFFTLLSRTKCTRVAGLTAWRHVSQEARVSSSS